jgi:hypothetical protein
MDGLHALDPLKNLEAHSDQGVTLAIGLVVTLYVENGHEPERRSALAQCFDDYWNVSGGALQRVTRPRHKADGSTQFNWVPARGGDLVRPADWVHSLSPDHPWSISATGAEATTDASAYSFEISAVGAWRKRLSYLTASWPIGHFQGQPRTFRATVREWVERLKPLHGYAGMGVLLPLDVPSAARAAPLALGLATRFPGLELDAPVSQTETLAAGIKGVNWLTAVADRLLAPLGGRDGLKAALDGRFETYDYEGGLVIQAGPAPELGDANQRLDASTYRHLSRLLSPIRARFEHSFMRGLSTEQALAWLSRFD